MYIFMRVNTRSGFVLLVKYLWINLATYSMNLMYLTLKIKPEYFTLFFSTTLVYSSVDIFEQLSQKLHKFSTNDTH